MIRRKRNQLSIQINGVTQIPLIGEGVNGAQRITFVEDVVNPMLIAPFTSIPGDAGVSDRARVDGSIGVD